MSTEFHRLPQPFINRIGIAGSRLRVGALCEFRRDPEDKRLWKLYHPLQPGGNHQNMFVAPDRGLEYYEAGEQVLYVQVFGSMRMACLLRKGERVFGELYSRGRTSCGGTPLVSAGDGTGALVAASRFISAARVAATAVENCDLTDAEDDQLVLCQTEIYRGEVAVAG